MQQLSPLDASFLYLETETNPQHVLAVLLLDPDADGGFDADAFARVLRDRIHLVPAFGRALATVPLNLDAPYWVQQPDVHLDEHLHRVTCPSPGDLPALGRLVGEIGSRRLDRRRPLWEIHVVDGLRDDQHALIVKAHHSTMYGAAGIVSLISLLDPFPEIAVVPPPRPAAPEPRPDPLELLTRATRRLASGPARGVRLAARSAARAADVGRTVVAATAGPGRVGLPFASPHTAVNGQVTARRRAAFATVPFADVERVKTGFGVKVNDVVLAAIAGSLRAYLLTHGGVPQRPLVAAIPVQTGSGSVQGTDQLTASLVPLAVDVENVTERLVRTAAAARDSRRFTDALGHEIVGEAMAVIPPPLLVGGARLYERWRVSRLHPPLQSLIVSNVVGPPAPLYAAGARVAAIFPFGPLLPGSGLNVTVVSNAGELDVGVLGCPDVVEDVWAVADGFAAAVEQLRLAAEAR